MKVKYNKTQCAVFPRSVDSVQGCGFSLVTSDCCYCGDSIGLIDFLSVPDAGGMRAFTGQALGSLWTFSRKGGLKWTKAYPIRYCICICIALHIHCIALHIVLYCTVLYCNVLHCTVLYCTVLYCTDLCPALPCPALCCAALCCLIVLYSDWMHVMKFSSRFASSKCGHSIFGSYPNKFSPLFEWYFANFQNVFCIFGPLWGESISY